MCGQTQITGRLIILELVAFEAMFVHLTSFPELNGTARKVFCCLLFGMLLSFSGCLSSDDPGSDITLNWSFSPDPVETGVATFQVTLADSTGQLIEGADVEFEANMSHPGMTPILGSLSETDSGHYSGDVEFTMGGDWYILIEATLPDERVVERQIDIPGVLSQ